MRRENQQAGRAPAPAPSHGPGQQWGPQTLGPLGRSRPLFGLFEGWLLSLGCLCWAWHKGRESSQPAPTGWACWGTPSPPGGKHRALKSRLPPQSHGSWTPGAALHRLQGALLGGWGRQCLDPGGPKDSSVSAPVKAPQSFAPRRAGCLLVCGTQPGRAVRGVRGTACLPFSVCHRVLGR